MPSTISDISELDALVGAMAIKVVEAGLGSIEEYDGGGLEDISIPNHCAYRQRVMDQDD